MQIKIINFGGKLPQRAHYNDAGADIFAAVSYTLGAGETKAIPVGIGLKLSDGYMGVIYNKSGLSSKGILNSNAPIDSGYTGEIHAILTNTTNKKFEVKQGMKVGQLVILPIILATFTKEDPKQRGSNGFGSTGDYIET